MNYSLTRLESKRKSLYKKLEEVGDFRRGSISVNYRKCGKKTVLVQHRGILATGRNIYGAQRLKEKATPRI